MNRLTEMEAFVAVVREGGFTDGARKLGLSKSAMSKHVAALEARLGARLLHRTTRRVFPTELGLAYYDRACLVLADMSEADAVVRGARHPPAGLVRLGLTRDLLPCLWADLLPDFLRRHPALQLQIVSHAAGQALEMGDFDLALCLGDIAGSAAAARILCRDRLRWVASPSYIAEHGVPSDPQGQRLIHYPLAPQLDGVAVLHLSDAAMALDAVIAGLGLAQLPQSICAHALRMGQLQDLALDQGSGDLPVQLLMHIKGMAPPKIGALASALQAHFAAAIPQAEPLPHGG